MTLYLSLMLKHTVFERKIRQESFYFTESVLQVCNVDLENGGEYLCTASDGYNTVTANNATVVTVLPNEGKETR